MKRELIIKDTHRGLWYEDGVMKKILEAGRYEIPDSSQWLFGARKPKVEVTLVDMRERDLTIKGQEILTADKVAIRVSIVAQYKVTDPCSACHKVVSFEDRLYTDVQLAARRSLASMSLEEILTNRNQLSEDILRDVKEIAAGYGVAMLRADVKDLVFPGNLQEIMNKVLAAERMSQAKLVETRTELEKRKLEWANEAEIQVLRAEADAKGIRTRAESAAEEQRIKAQADTAAVLAQEAMATFYKQHPAMLRLKEIEALSDLGRNAMARIYRHGKVAIGVAWGRLTGWA